MTCPDLASIHKSLHPVFSLFPVGTLLVSREGYARSVLEVPAKTSHRAGDHPHAVQPTDKRETRERDHFPQTDGWADRGSRRRRRISESPVMLLGRDLKHHEMQGIFCLRIATAAPCRSLLPFQVTACRLETVVAVWLLLLPIVVRSSS
jgi:hypothetical protein